METNGVDLTTWGHWSVHERYNDTPYALDYLEGEAVLSSSQDLNNAWFKKVDKQYWGGKHQESIW